MIGAALLAIIPACTLLSVEPDEIDIADDETGGAEAGESSASGAGGESTDTSNEGDSDSDTDPTGDGDGDAATSSDSDSGSEGTDDPGTDTDTGTSGGDGDGDDAGSGDSDGPEACEGLVSGALELGLTPIELAGASSVASMCGGDGPELLFSYTSIGDAAYSLALLDAEYGASLAIVTSCDPLEELSCVSSPDPLSFDLVDGETIYILVDALTPEAGIGTLELLQL